MGEPSRRTFLLTSAVTAAALSGCVGGRSADAALRRTTGETATTTAGTTRETETTENTETAEDGESTGEDPEHIAWRFDFDGEVRLGPTVYSDSLFVGAESGLLRALDPEDGSERWRFDTERAFYSGTAADDSPLLVGDALYAVSGNRARGHGDDFAVYALDAETGEERWSVERDFPKSLSLLGVAGDRVFVGTSDDALGGQGESLLAFEADTGEEAWTAEIGDAEGAAVTEDAVYVTSPSRLDAFDAADGSRRFERELAGRTLGPAVGEGVVFAGYVDGRDSAALALDPESGETRWTVGDRFVTSLVADGALYVGGERVAEFGSDGTERWGYDAGGLLSEDALAEDMLLVSGDPVTALSIADGAPQWSYQVEAELGVVEGADEQVVAVRRGNGTVLDVVDAGSGEKQFTFDAGGDRLSAVAVSSGTVYAGSDAGAVYALEN